MLDFSSFIAIWHVIKFLFLKRKIQSQKVFIHLTSKGSDKCCIYDLISRSFGLLLIAGERNRGAVTCVFIGEGNFV